MANYFLGFYDIASQLSDFRNGLKSNGHKAQIGLYKTSSVIVRNEGDFVVNKQNPNWIRFLPFFIKREIEHFLILSQKKRLFKKIIKETDVFIFFWESFEKNFSDFKKLKDLNKKIVVFLVGDDVRWYEAMNQEAVLKGLEVIEYKDYYLHHKLTDKLTKLRNTEKYADLIFSHPDTSQLGIRPYQHYYIPIDLKMFSAFKSQRKKRPLIIHAPSDRNIKGTKYILEAVEKLKAEAIDFDFMLVENTKYLQAIEIYKECDILVGQVLAHGGGKQGHELLALGKVVISRMDYKSYINNVANECPIIDSNPSNLYQVLKEIILNYELRCQLAEKGPIYIKKYHDVNSICRLIHDALFSHPIQPDYEPTFFIEKYIPEKKFIKFYNRMTAMIKNCDWYEKRIETKKRKGLIF